MIDRVKLTSFLILNGFVKSANSPDCKTILNYAESFNLKTVAELIVGLQYRRNEAEPVVYVGDGYLNFKKEVLDKLEKLEVNAFFEFDIHKWYHHEAISVDGHTLYSSTGEHLTSDEEEEAELIIGFYGYEKLGFGHINDCSYAFNGNIPTFEEFKDLITKIVPGESEFYEKTFFNLIEYLLKERTLEESLAIVNKVITSAKILKTVEYFLRANK